MLFILFRLGKERYALKAAHVVDVIARLPLRPQPGTRDFVASLSNSRDKVVPVLDLGRLALGTPCRRSSQTPVRAFATVRSLYVLAKNSSAFNNVKAVALYKTRATRNYCTAS